MFYRAAILRSAHAVARRSMAPSRDYRFGDRWNSEAGGYVPHGLTYRTAFAEALRWAWREAKIIAEEQAWAATQTALADDIVDRIAAIRADAWFEPITAAGNERYRALHDQADAVEADARSNAVDLIEGCRPADHFTSHHAEKHQLSGRRSVQQLELLEAA